MDWVSDDSIWNSVDFRMSLLILLSILLASRDSFSSPVIKRNITIAGDSIWDLISCRTGEFGVEIGSEFGSVFLIGSCVFGFPVSYKRRLALQFDDSFLAEALAFFFSPRPYFTCACCKKCLVKLEIFHFSLYGFWLSLFKILVKLLHLSQRGHLTTALIQLDCSSIYCYMS